MSYLAPVDDTYAEAFRSIYAEILITARDRYWVDKAVEASTGNASSTIMCDCEAAMSHYVEPDQTPDSGGSGGAVPRPRFLEGSSGEAGTLIIGTHRAERPHLPDDRLLQHHE